MSLNDKNDGKSTTTGGGFFAENAPDEDKKTSNKDSNFLQLWTPDQCKEWEMPKDYLLAGDFHLTRGGITVIGGVPGCGKSRVSVALGIAGATGEDWMGLKIHSKFKTLIIQAENGPARLKSEFSDLPPLPDGVRLDEYIRITPPPTYGFRFDDPDFRKELKEHIEQFEPGVIVLDPWNRTVIDDKQKDYKAAIEWILECLPDDIRKRPAIVIVAHLRKSGSGDGHKRGRDLLPELSGSGMIGSAARSVFILEPASPDSDDRRVVWTCAKNNDGHEGAPSAWYRCNGLFDPVGDFDFDEFFAGGAGGRLTITPEAMERAMEGAVSKNTVVKRLMDETGCSKSAAYAALADGGRFGANIDETPDGQLLWVA